MAGTLLQQPTLKKTSITDSSTIPKEVDSTGVLDTNVLTYDAASGKWKPAAASVAGGDVTSFNTRIGAVTLTKADVTGTGLAASDVSAVPTSAEGAASGVATLDSTTKLTGSQLPINVIIDSATTAAILDTTGRLNGQVLTFDNASGKWKPNTPTSAPVSSVFTRTGAITAQTGDYTAAQVGALASTNDLSAIATANITAANWSNNNKKITSLANGTVSTDAAAFGQIPTALPPNGSAGGDLSGTYPNPGVAQVKGKAVDTPTTKGDIYTYDGTAIKRLGVGTNGQALTANSAATTGVDWEVVVNSFNSRTGAVTPTTGDYTAAQVTNAADKSSASAQSFTAEVGAKDFSPSGLTGATAAGRYVGNTTAGAPSTGTFIKGDWITDQNGKRWTCTTGGSPGTWTQEPGVVTSVFTRTGAITAQTGDYTAAQVGALTSTSDISAIATANVTAANWSNNSKKITSLANGTAASDAAAFGQIPTALPPNGTAGGDLSGTFPNPSVAQIQGKAADAFTTKGDVYVYSGTAIKRLAVGSDGQLLTARSGATNGVDWETPTSGIGFGSVVAKVANYTILSGDVGTIFTFNGSNLTATLPATAPAAPWSTTILNLNSTPLTISPNGKTLNGSTVSTILLQNQGITTFSDGTNYEFDADLMNYVKITTSTTWVIPNGVTQVRIRAVGGGGGGGGGQVNAAAQSAGGTGGAAGEVTDSVVSLSGSDSSLTITIGSGAAHGAGKASGSTGAGSDGSKGGTTTVVGATSATTYASAAGGQGGQGGASSGSQVSNSSPGGASGIGALANQNVVGGAGGGISTQSTHGGTGGGAATGSIPTDTTPGTLNGQASGPGGVGTTATTPGCGGGGGGASFSTASAGGNGGDGAPGQFEAWW